MASWPEAKAAMEKAVAAVLGVAFTAPTATNSLGNVVYENCAHTPEEGVPYATVLVDPATPSGHELGGGAERQGLVNVLLYYPPDKGSGDADAKAWELVVGMKAKTTATEGGTTVQVHMPPGAYQGEPMALRWVVPVRIPFKITA